MDPATWIYLALLAASTAASAKSQQKTNQARTKVAAEERDRRKEQEKEAQAAAQKTQDAYFNQKDNQATREAEIAKQYEAQPVAPTTTDAAGTKFLDTAAPTSSTRTIEATKQEMAKGRARSAQSATAIAQLGAFGDTMAAAGREAGHNAQDIARSASNVNSWTANVMPALYAKANMAGKDWSTAADVMKIAAAVMGSGALSGAGTNAEAGTEAGVLDRMGGMPKEFAGRDLFGMGSMGLGSAGGSGLGAAATGAGAFGSAGLVQNAAQMAAMRKMWQFGMGALTPAEQALIHANY